MGALGGVGERSLAGASAASTGAGADASAAGAAAAASSSAGTGSGRPARRVHIRCLPRGPRPRPSP
eukprot:1245669-Alexandrium_andersonii.AAC.1